MLSEPIENFFIHAIFFLCERITIDMHVGFFYVGAETEHKVKKSNQQEAAFVSVHIYCQLFTCGFIPFCITCGFISLWVSFFIFYVNKYIMG